MAKHAKPDVEQIKRGITYEEAGLIARNKKQPPRGMSRPQYLALAQQVLGMQSFDKPKK